MSVLQTIDLKKYYGTKPNITHALDGVNFSVEDGEFVAIVGTSGSGKSTLLHMMGGLDTPTSGSVIVRDKELSKMNDEQLTIFRRRNIGFIFQNYNLVPILNVYENIVLPVELDGDTVDQIPSAAREAIRKAVEPVKDEILTYNGSVCDAVWSASAGYNTQTGVYGTCSSRDAWGTEVPYLQSVESPYEEQYHNLLRRSIGKDYTYVEYNDSRTGEPYTDADTTHKSLGGYVQYNTFVSNGRSYRYIGQFVSSRYCFDFGTDENGTPCMTYYGFGHGVGMSQCGAVGYAAERNMGYKAILRHYYKGASITSQGSSGGLFGWLRSLFG